MEHKDATERKGRKETGGGGEGYGGSEIMKLGGNPPRFLAIKKYRSSLGD